MTCPCSLGLEECNCCGRPVSKAVEPPKLAFPAVVVVTIAIGVAGSFGLAVWLFWNGVTL